MRLFSKRKLNNHGTTMVELIVTFALISLFASGIFQIVSTSLKTYERIKDFTQASQVSDTLLEKITGVISSAQVGVAFEEYETNTGASLVVFDRDDKSSIELIDKTGCRVTMSKYKEDSNEQEVNDVNGLFKIHYNALTVEDISYNEFEWQYDDSAYMGFKVKNLKFSLPGVDENGPIEDAVYPPNVVKIDLTLIKESTGNTYTFTRYVRAYNFGNQTAFNPGPADPDNPNPDPDPPKDGYINIYPNEPKHLEPIKPEFDINEMYPNVDKWQPVPIPKGLIKYNGVYYFATNERNWALGDLSQSGSSGTSADIIALKFQPVITQDSPQNGEGIFTNVSSGCIYFHEETNSYYIYCQANGSPYVNPTDSRGSGWIEVDNKYFNLIQ